MKEFQMLLRDVAQNGQTFQYNKQNIWLEPLKEFHISCKIVDDIQAEVFILPEEDGCLLRGKLHGKVSVPCRPYRKRSSDIPPPHGRLPHRALPPGTA